jgi:hypothetical protein
MLPLRRGVKRIVYASGPSDLRCPSIHPKQSAWSRACGQSIEGLPLPFFQKPTSSSGAVA